LFSFFFRFPFFLFLYSLVFLLLPGEAMRKYFTPTYFSIVRIYVYRAGAIERGAGGGGNFGVLSGSMKLRTIVSKRAINLLRQSKVIANLVREI